MDPLTIASLASTAIGAFGSARASAKANKELQKEIKDNESDYKKDYYGDYTQRADVQNALGRMRGLMKERADARRGTAAVMGSTPEAVVAGQKTDNAALGETVSSIAGQASNYKDIVKARYQSNRSALRMKQAAVYDGQAEQFGKLASTAATIGAKSMVPNGAIVDDKDVVPGDILQDQGQKLTDSVGNSYA